MKAVAAAMNAPLMVVHRVTPKTVLLAMQNAARTARRASPVKGVNREKAEMGATAAMVAAAAAMRNSAPQVPA